MREAAGARFDALELNTLIQAVAVTLDRARTAERMSGAFGIPAAAVLDTPCARVGSESEIEAQLRGPRERFGISYSVVFERDMEAFAPIASRLAGT